MTRLLLLATCLTGCFYTESINQRPALAIENQGTTIYRGDVVTFKALVDDPEEQNVAVRWSAYLCGPADVGDPQTFQDCDEQPVQTSTDPFFYVTVLKTRDGSPDPTRGLKVVLEGQDALGADAKLAQRLSLAVENRPPIVTADGGFVYAAIENTPYRVFAQYEDPDDDLSNVELTFHAFAPQEVPFDDFVPVGAGDTPAPTHPGAIQRGVQFTPTMAGTWSVLVTVTDPIGPPVETLVPLEVRADSPPCLDRYAPAVPPSGSVLPLSEPTLFSTHAADDLDAYPQPVLAGMDDPRGALAFSWFMRVGAGAFQRVEGEVGNELPFDPTAYPAGTAVDVRVEVVDTNHLVPNCPESDPTCSVVSSTCLQRQTWRVETR